MAPACQVAIGDSQYPIYVGRDIGPEIWGFVERLPGRGRVAVITDETVARLHAATLLVGRDPLPRLIALPPGEATKSLAQAAALYDILAAERFERGDVLIAFGGGVVGDLTGFVAATWVRGLRYVQVPTTLEAAIDAAVGGKTGVNHAAGKNLIGAFHQPVGVFIDTAFLATLPQRDFAAGLAESVKHAAIRDPAFLDWHGQNAGAIVGRVEDVVRKLIQRNCEIKADVVSCDERERDLRAILNHGHTVGHALEHALGFELRHGECVGLGMIVENEIARRRGWLDEEDAETISQLLASFGLPTRLPRAIDDELILTAMRADKKNRAGAVGFVLLRGIGQPVQTFDVSDDDVRTALGALG